MNTWSPLLLTTLFFGQAAKPVVTPSSQAMILPLNLKPTVMTPQAMLRAMVALDRAQRDQPGAVVEVIGYDEEAILNLMALTIAERVRKEFNSMDKQGHQDLYSFMHQDPNRPCAAPATPMLAGGKISRPEDKWLR
jgi:hypothetical protein